MSISLQTIVQFLDIFHSSPNIPGYCDVDVANLEEDERRDASLKDHNRIFLHNNIQAGHGIIDGEVGMVSRFQILFCKHRCDYRSWGMWNFLKGWPGRIPSLGLTITGEFRIQFLRVNLTPSLVICQLLTQINAKLSIGPLLLLRSLKRRLLLTTYRRFTGFSYFPDRVSSWTTTQSGVHARGLRYMKGNW